MNIITKLQPDAEMVAEPLMMPQLNANIFTANGYKLAKGRKHSFMALRLLGTPAELCMKYQPTIIRSLKTGKQNRTFKFPIDLLQFSLWTSILTILFSIGVQSALSGHTGQWVPIARLAGAALVFLLYMASLVLGIVALCGMREHGKEGILWQSITGITLSLGIFLFVGVFVVHGALMAMQNRKAAAAVTQAAREVHEETKQDFNRDHKITMESAQPKIDKLKTTLDGVAKEGSADMALAANATKAYLEKVQALMSDYSAAAKLLRSPPVLNMSGVESREQLQAKRKVVENFMAANEKLMAFITRGEKPFREELVRFKVSEEMTESVLKGYRGKATERNILQVKIRQTDQQIGTSMLGILDVLDASWGGWKYSAEKKKTIFSDTAALEKYNDYSKTIQLAADEQNRLLGKLVNLP